MDKLLRPLLNALVNLDDATVELNNQWKEINCSLDLEFREEIREKLAIANKVIQELDQKLGEDVYDSEEVNEVDHSTILSK